MTDALPPISGGLAAVKRLQRLGLLENPYSPYADARYFHPCIEHATLYQEILRMAADPSGKSLALVMGSPGTGKTTLAWRLAHAVFPNADVSLQGVLVEGEIETPTVFIRKVNEALELETRKSLEDRMKLLYDFTLQATRSGSGLFIVVDASPDAAIFYTILEILQWKAPEGTPLMVRVAVFSAENLFALEGKKPELSELIGVRHTLGNLSFASASSVVETRAKMAGRSAPLFSPDALNELTDSSQGHPARLIELANRAFILLLQSNESSIDLPMLMAAKADSD